MSLQIWLNFLFILTNKTQMVESMSKEYWTNKVFKMYLKLGVQLPSTVNLNL